MLYLGVAFTACEGVEEVKVVDADKEGGGGGAEFRKEVDGGAAFPGSDFEGSRGASLGEGGEKGCDERVPGGNVVGEPVLGGCEEIVFVHGFVENYGEAEELTTPGVMDYEQMIWSYKMSGLTILLDPDIFGKISFT